MTHFMTHFQQELAVADSGGSLSWHNSTNQRPTDRKVAEKAILLMNRQQLAVSCLTAFVRIQNGND